MLAIPACADVCGQMLMLVALILLNASTHEMLRHFSFVITAMLAT
jgi:hypothetical protein